MTTALCLIVKNTPEELSLALKNVAKIQKHFTKVYITLNGPEQSITLPENKDNIVFSYTEWLKDFAVARNFNFSQAKEQWLMWIDADDEVRGLERLQDIIKGAEDNGVKAIMLKYLYDHDDRGNVTTWHWKTRIIRNDGHGAWRGKIHEDFLQMRKSKWDKSEGIVIDHHTTNERGAESIERNIDILMAEYESQGENKDPRTLFYIGTAFLQLSKLDEAESSYKEYLTLSGWPEERYDVYQRLGDIECSRKNMDKARDWYLKGAQECPQYPDSYFNVAKSYSIEEDWEKVIEWSLIGFTKKKPDSMTMNFPRLLTIVPGSIYAYALLMRGKLDEAMASITSLRQLDPKDEYLDGMFKVISEAYKTREMSKWMVKWVQDLKDGKEEFKIPALLQAVPARLQSNSITTFLRGEHMPAHKWGEKSIVFFCGLTAEPWDPRSLGTGGIGGSETAIIHLAQRLQKKGWEVTVFNWCHTAAGEYDGVIYKNLWEFSLNDEYNKLVIWREANYLGYDLKAKQIYIDLHDVPEASEFTKDRVEKLTKIFVKSQYHRSLLPQVPDEKFAIIPNGIDTDRFAGDEEKIPHSVIYSSSPNRGLDTILGMWPKVREQFPDATLRVFYGWNTFYALQKNNPASIAWMQTIQKQMDNLTDQGVISMGRVDQNELARWQMKSTVWAYPTMFSEISCITAMEAQAAGATPVVSDYAALSETVQYGVKIPAPISRPKNKEAFLEALLKQIDSKDDTSVMSAWAKETYDWDPIAEKWNDEFSK